MFMFRDPGYQAYRILQLVFIIAPIVAGADKFIYFLTDWSKYLSPYALKMLHGHGSQFMMVVGIVEMIVGIGVIFRPTMFAYVVSLWLLAIIVNLLMTGHYYDIALRDFGLSLSAFALARLSTKYNLRY